MKKFYQKKAFKVTLISLVIILGIGFLGYLFKDMIFSSKNDTSHTLIPVKQSKLGDIGFVNFDGELIIDFDLDLDSGENIGYMYDGIAFYMNLEENSEGEIEKEGIVFVDSELKETQTEYYQSLYFHEDLALVVKEFGKLQYIDRDYKEVFTLDNAKKAGYFSQGLAKFQNEEGKWGYIDKTGEIAIEAEYDQVRSFNENGYATVWLIENEKKKDEWEVGIIDKSGKEIIKISDKYRELYATNEGVWFWKYDLKRGESEDHEAGLMTIDGEEIFEEEWYQSTFFHNKYASFVEWDEDFEYEKREWGLVDLKGEVVIKAKEDKPIYLYNNLYVYKSGEKYGFKDIEGKKVIKAKYKNAYPFLGEGAFVQTKSGSWKYIDKEGEEIKGEKDNDIDSIVTHYYQGSGYDIVKYLVESNTPFNINSTLSSKYLAIDNLLENLFDGIEYDIFGGGNNTSPSEIFDYLINKENLIDGEVDKVKLEDWTEDKSEWSDNIGSNELFDYKNFTIDDDFSYSLNYEFDEYVIGYKTYCTQNHRFSCSQYIYEYSEGWHNSYKRKDYESGKQFNTSSNLQMITANINLDGNAYGQAEKIINEISSFLINNDYNEEIIYSDEGPEGADETIYYENSESTIYLSDEYDQIVITITFSSNTGDEAK